MSGIVLYDYWRSSSSYRVRIALNLLKLDHDRIAINLLEGEQRSRTHLARNPQGLVPALEIDGIVLTQSLAIIEYLDETRQAGFLPADPVARARVRALSHAIAMDIHPVCNLSVLNRVGEIDDTPDARKKWVQATVGKGLSAYETMLGNWAGRFSYGDSLGMADMCLVPQLYNAVRWEVDLEPFPLCRRIAETCEALPAFAAAHPQTVQPATG